MGFCWRFLVPVGLLFVVVAAVERTLLIEENWNANVALPIYAVVNIALTVAVVGFYAVRSGSAAQRLPSTTIMARGRLGGLRAAREVAQRAAAPAAGSGD